MAVDSGSVADEVRRSMGVASSISIVECTAERKSSAAAAWFFLFPQPARVRRLWTV